MKVNFTLFYEISFLFYESLAFLIATATIPLSVYYIKYNQKGGLEDKFMGYVIIVGYVIEILNIFHPFISLQFPKEIRCFQKWSSIQTKLRQCPLFWKYVNFIYGGYQLITTIILLTFYKSKIFINQKAMMVEFSLIICKLYLTGVLLIILITLMIFRILVMLL